MFFCNDIVMLGEFLWWVNGMIGIVICIFGGVVCVDIDGEEVDVEFVVWEWFWYVYDLNIKKLLCDVVVEFM